MMSQTHSRAGALFGLAIGDALGAAVEFMSLGQIRAAYRPGGITVQKTALLARVADWAARRRGRGSVTAEP